MTRVSTEHGWLVLESFVFILGQLSTGHVVVMGKLGLRPFFRGLHLAHLSRERDCGSCGCHGCTPR